MSLVYEALQKAAKEKHSKTPAVPAPMPVKQPEPAPPAPVVLPVARPNYTGLIVACVSIVALAAIVLIVLMATRNLAEKPTSEPVAAGETSSITAESKSADLPEPTPVTPPVNSTANDPRFKLTGIMKMGESYGAVINGRIVYETQYVDGAIVKKVERDRVTLNVDGREIIVRLF